jgi:hypothetical protein
MASAHARPLCPAGTASLVTPDCTGLQNDLTGYLLKVGQLEYDCRYSKMHGMLVTSGRGF